MASLHVLVFDHEGRPIQFDTWLDDLHLYLLSDSRDSVLLFDHTSCAAPAPPAIADSATHSQWLTRDVAARLAIRNHLPLAVCAHFGHHRTSQALYDPVVAHYSSPATAALGRLLLPYLFPELSAFATVEDARYRAALLTEFLDKNPPPMDHFLAHDPTALTVDLLEQHLLASETSVVADVGVASASGKHCSSKGKGGRGGGGGSGGGGGGSSGGGGGSGGGGNGGSGGGSGGFGSGGGDSGGGGGSGGSGSGGGRAGNTQRGGSRRGQRLQEQHRIEPPSPQQLREWFAQRGASGGSGSCPSGVDIFALEYDAILAAMYGLSVITKGDCYWCVPPDPGIEAAALGASESALLGTAPAAALFTFTLDSGASCCFFRDSTTLTPLSAPVPVRLVSASGLAAPPCSCRLLSHQTLLWHRRLGHPSLPRLRGMHSRLLISGLPRSLPPLPPSPAPPCLPCVEGRQRAAPHSSSFPPTTAPMQVLLMDLREDLPVLHLHSDRGGVVSSNLLRDFCRGEGILQSFTLPASPQKNGIAERRIGLVVEVARTSMIHAVFPIFCGRLRSGAARGVASGGAEPSIAEPGGAELRVQSLRVRGLGVLSLGVRSLGVLSLRVWRLGVLGLWVRSLGVLSLGRTLLQSGAAKAGSSSAGGTGAGGAGVPAGAGGTGGAGVAGPGSSLTRGTGAAGAVGAGGAGAGGTGAGSAGAGGVGAGDPSAAGAGAGGIGAGGTGAGGIGAGGAGAVDPGAGCAGVGGAASSGTGARGTVQRHPFFVPPPSSSLPPPDLVLCQGLSLLSSTGLPPSLLRPRPRQSQPQLQPDSPLYAFS
ncbi:unnamed protein product [Closterium sp. NIES-53]